AAAATASGGTPTAAPAAGAEPRWTRSGTKYYLAIQGDTVLSMDPEGMVALDLAEGTPLWDRTADSFYPPKARDGRVYVVESSDTVSALDPRTGEKLWSAELRGQKAEHLYPLTPGLLAVSDKANTLYGFDASRGKRLWSFASGEALHVPWEYARGTVLAVAFVGTWPFRAVALSARNGRRRWSHSARLHVACGDGERFYVLDEDLRLKALDPASGKVVWNVASGLPRQGSKEDSPDYYLTFEEGTVVCTTGGLEPNLLTAFDAKSGRRRWRVETDGSTTWVRSGGTFCYLQESLRAIDFGTGAALWTAEKPPTTPDASSTSIIGGVENQVVTASGTGFQGWDLATGAPVWTKPRAGADRPTWFVQRARDRLVLSGDDTVLAYDFPGAAAPSRG
ncbi:PQQ-binding-like beta-propeller repeat protein, partial [Actinocorallia lasiicapitis]